MSENPNIERISELDFLETIYEFEDELAQNRLDHITYSSITAMQTDKTLNPGDTAIINGAIYDTLEVAEVEDETDMTDPNMIYLYDGTYYKGDSGEEAVGFVSENGFIVVSDKNTYVTPEMFGAVCDGATNDAAALGQCFAYAAASGLIVYIPENMVVGWNDPIFMPSNLHFVIDGELRAVGANAQLETYDRVTQTPEYTSSHDVVIEGTGAINMRGHILTTGGPTPLRIHHAKNVIIRDISILDLSMYHAIECGGTDGLTVDNVKFKGMHPNGMDGRHEFVQLERITETGTGGAVPYDGTPTINVIIRNCYFGAGDNGGACYTAVGVHDSSTNYIQNVLIENCEIDKSVVFALAFAGGVDGLTVRNCHITREPNGGTHAQPTASFQNCKNVIFEGNYFGDCYGRHLTMGDGAPATTVENVVIKNNIFNEYGTSGQDALGVFINCTNTNLEIINNVFKSSLSTSNRPIHIGVTTLSTYTKDLNIVGNVFYAKSLDADNIQRWNKSMGRVTLFSGTAKNEGDYTLSDSVYKYDMLEIRYTRPGASVGKHFTTATEGGISENLEYIWFDSATPKAQLLRLLVTFEGTKMTVGRNQALAFDIVNGAIANAVYNRVTDTSPVQTFLEIGKVVGISNANKIVYVP